MGDGSGQGCVPHRRCPSTASDGGLSPHIWTLQEHYRSLDATTESPDEPPKSLLSLPVELLRAIDCFSTEKDHQAFRLVCFQILEALSDSQIQADATARGLLIYVGNRVSARGTAFAVSASTLNLLFLTILHFCHGSYPREHQLLPTDSPDRSPRVSAALDRTNFFIRGVFPPLEMDESTAQILEDLQSIDLPQRKLLIEHMAVSDTDIRPDYLEQWAPLLRFFDPVTVNLQAASTGDLPSIVRVPPHAVASLLTSWTRLEGVSCYGPGSVPLFEPPATDCLPSPPSGFALREILRVSDGREESDCVRVSLDALSKELRQETIFLSKDSQHVEEANIEEALARAAENPPDPSQFHVGLFFNPIHRQR